MVHIYLFGPNVVSVEQGHHRSPSVWKPDHFLWLARWHRRSRLLFVWLDSSFSRLSQRTIRGSLHRRRDTGEHAFKLWTHDCVQEKSDHQNASKLHSFNDNVKTVMKFMKVWGLSTLADCKVNYIVCSSYVVTPGIDLLFLNLKTNLQIQSLKGQALALRQYRIPIGSTGAY